MLLLPGTGSPYLFPSQYPEGGPLGIASLIGDFDFSDSTTLFTDTARTTPVTADGDRIKGVTDKSGQGNHLAQSVTGPTYKLGVKFGRSGARFANVANERLTSSTPASTVQPWTWVTVLKATAGTGTYLIAGSSALTVERDVVYFDPTGKVGTMAGGTGITGTVDRTGVWHMVTAIGSAPASVLRLDGTQEATGNNGSGELVGIGIGAFFDDSLRFAGDIGEVLVFNELLSAEELATVETYLYTKWINPVTVDIDTAGQLNLLGQSIGLTNVITPTAGALTLTGQVVGLKSSIAPTAASLTLTGQPTGFAFGTVATAGQLTLTGQTVGIRTTIAPTAAQLTLTGQAIGLKNVIDTTAGLLTLSGGTVTLVTSGPTTVNIDTPGQLNLTGQTIGLKTLVAPTAAALTLAGQTVGLKTLIGLQPGSITFAGGTVTLVTSGPVVVNITTAGLLALVGQQVAFSPLPTVVVESYDGALAGGVASGAVRIISKDGSLAGGAPSSLELLTVAGAVAGGAPAGTPLNESTDGPTAGGAASGSVLVESAEG